MAKRKFKKKIIKKNWYTILSPKFLGEKPIGETYLSDLKDAVGRTIKVNLMSITKDIKSQPYSVKFKIDSARDTTLNTSIVGYYLSESTIKRYVRRRMSRIDDSLVLESKDKDKVRIKPFLLTRGLVSRAVRENIRASLKKELTEFVNKNKTEDVFGIIISYKIQRDLRSALNKIYPVRSLEIRMIEQVLEGKKGKVEELEIIEEEVKEEKKEEVKEEKKETKEKETEKEEEKEEKPKKEKKAEEKTEKKETKKEDEKKTETKKKSSEKKKE